MCESQLSLVAQFDDLARCTSILSAGVESEFYSFVRNQENLRIKWLDTHQGSRDLKRKLKDSESANSTLETKLKHARGQIDHEMKKRKMAEEDRDRLERQIIVVRELLMDSKATSMLNDKDRERLSFLNSDVMHHNYDSPVKGGNLSVIEESKSMHSLDIFDDTNEDELNQDDYKSPSAPPAEHTEKRRRSNRRKKHRRSRSAVITTTTVTVGDGTVEAESEIRGDPDASPKKRRSARLNKKHHSSSRLQDMKENMDSDDSYVYNQNLKNTPLSNIGNSPNGTPTLRHQGSIGKGLNRVHAFVSKLVIRPETCVPCGKRIWFGKESMKCIDCRATAHPECKDLVPLPCVPGMQTPGNGKNGMGYLSDYAPNDPPHIPSLIIHCVNEVEARGLTEEGIYRMPGSKEEVEKLKDKFLRGKGTPNLNRVYDINVVCGCIKDFLRGIKEPVVTFALWKEFVNAAEMHDIEESVSLIYQAVSRLPPANRDTLAFMILHLQRVAECPETKMGTDNLCKVFGPTLIGYSTADTEPMQIITETAKQARVMERLMSIQSDYWTNFICIDTEAMIPMDVMTPQTPDTKPVLHSMLGPVGTPTSESTPTTSRFGSRARRTKKNHTTFFSSPMLK